MTAQQAAERAARILTTPRGSQPGFPLAGTAGGLSLTPPNLTPKSWSRTGGSSLSGSAGQFGTKVIRGGRGLVIGGVATLCVLAGIGGFFVASSLKKSPRPAASVEEPAAARKMKMVGPAATQPATANNATAAMTGSTPGTHGASGSATSDPEKAAAAKTEPAKAAAGTSEPAKTTAAKTAAKTTDAKTAGKSDAAKTAAAKSAAKTTDAKTAAKGDDPKTTAAKTADAKATAAKSSATKTDAKSSDAKTAAAKSSDAKTAAAKKTKTKSKQAKSKKSDDLDDLFDDRK
jgi:hypothetical protein